MAARRSNKRKRRNRGRFGFLYKVLSLIIILVVVAAGCAIFFRVNKIEVVGESKYTAEQIIAASGIEPGDNLFLLPQFSSAKQILTELPYVDAVNPRWVLPDKVVITVTECTPAAVVQGGGSWWIIDAKGKLLEEVSSGQQRDLATVTGITALLPTAGTKLAVESEFKVKLQSLKELMQALDGRGMLSKVTSFDLSGSGNILMGYDGRFTVKLPLTMEAGGFANRVLALERTLEQLQPNESGDIDLTRDDKIYFDPK